MRVRQHINEIVINGIYSANSGYDWITNKSRSDWFFYRYSLFKYESKNYQHVNLKIVNYYFKRRDNFECCRFYHICG